MKPIDIFGLFLTLCTGIGVALLVYLAYKYVPEIMWYLFGVVSGAVFTIFVATFQSDKGESDKWRSKKD